MMVVVGEWVRLGAHIHCLVCSVHSRLPVVSMMFTVALPPASTFPMLDLQMITRNISVPSVILSG